MKYYHKLYVSDELQFHIKEIKQDFIEEKLQFNKYLVVLAKNEKNHLEFFDSVLLQQRVFSREELFVVGIADGYFGALKLVERITNDVYTETKGTDIRNYFIRKQQEFEERNV